MDGCVAQLSLLQPCGDWLIDPFFLFEVVVDTVQYIYSTVEHSTSDITSIIIISHRIASLIPNEYEYEDVRRRALLFFYWCTIGIGPRYDHDLKKQIEFQSQSFHFFSGIFYCDDVS